MSFDRVTRNHSAGGQGGGAGMGQMTPEKRTPRVIAFPHEPPISARIGRIPGTAVLDPYGCEARGAPAFTVGLTSHFSSETPSLHVASHEATHQLQHAGLTNDAELGAERHAHEVANAVVAGTPAEALLGGHGAAVPSATRDYTELTVAEQTARRQWEVGADARIGDAGRTVTTTNRRDCWAERELITSANEILKAKKSGIELKEGSAGLIGPAPDGSGWKSLVEVIPNVDQYWADCGRASREVQGPTGTDTEARGVFKDSSGTKQETSVASNDPEALRNEIYVKGGLGPDSATAHAAYLALSPADKDAFDQRHGINRYAAPEVGESYVARRDDTQSSDGFNWHWGAVVMVAEPDRITFENFAKPGTTYNTKDDLWYFESHGPPTKPGQTFHEHNLSSVGAPDKNTTTMTTRTSSDPRDMSALGTAELVSRYNAATNDGERSVVETELKTRTITVNVKVKKAQEGTDQIYVYIAGSNGSHESGYRELADGGETTFYVPVSELLPIDGALSVRVYEYDAIFDDMISNIAWASPYAPQVDNRPWDDAEYHTTVKFNR